MKVRVVVSVAWSTSLVLTLGCERSPAPDPGSPGSARAAQSSACAPERALGALDTRTPVPLLPQMASHQRESMRDHLLAVQQVIAGVTVADFEGAERAAARLGSSEQMTRMCRHLGAGADGFTERALDFHRTADAIVEAARNRDAVGVLSSLDATLQRCTACHARFRQLVVDERAFAELTGKHEK